MTIKPGAYPGPGGMRTPHIHFNVASQDYRLVVQMYFPGESLNEKDLLLSTMAARYRDPAAVICRSIDSSEPSIKKFEWDIVLLQA
jgi:protocatechuate 3,4-dioxygenase beta subunit